MTKGVKMNIKEKLLSPEFLEIGRKAVEDVLIEWRDNRLSIFHRGNGLVIREKDGTGSSIIRLGTEDALRIGITAMFSVIEEATDDKIETMGDADRPETIRTEFQDNSS